MSSHGSPFRTAPTFRNWKPLFLRFGIVVLQVWQGRGWESLKKHQQVAVVTPPRKPKIENAEGPEPIKSSEIAIIDIDFLIKNTKAFHFIRKLISNKRSIFQELITQEETRLRKSNEDLARKRTLLSADQFDRHREKFENEVNLVQKRVQKLKAELDNSQALQMALVQSELNNIVTVIAEQRNLKLILHGPKERTRDDYILLSAKYSSGEMNNLFNRGATNLTQEVLRRLDARLPSISSELENILNNNTSL
jgi:Skp family chaperone for outer membrane proteins